MSNYKLGDYVEIAKSSNTRKLPENTKLEIVDLDLSGNGRPGLLKRTAKYVSLRDDIKSVQYLLVLGDDEDLNLLIKPYV